ncbi:MAG: trigger factor [Gammaproteobacteria bacterium]|nr:MAG: trigger factor [Gammaproteobacteria bacterium]
MQVSVESTSNLERRMTVGVPAEMVEVDLQKRLKEMAGTARINGFRPGKVPMREVKRRYGKALRDEVVGGIISRTFYEAVEAEDLKLAGAPDIQSSEEKEGGVFEYVAVFEVYPEVTLVMPDDAVIDKPVASVSDEDLEKVLDNIRSQNKTWQLAERAAADGDQVNIDFLGTLDGEEFDGGSAQGTPLELGSKSMIPGFEDGLVGAAAGDKKVLDLTFPDEYQSEELAGKSVQFAVTVNEVKEAVLPEFDEEFLGTLGVKDKTVDGLKAEIQKNLEGELEQAVKNKVKGQIMDALVDANTVEVPNSLVKGEINRMQQQMMSQFGGGQQFDSSIFPEDMFTDQATRSVKLGLLVGELIKTDEIKADPERVRSMIEDKAKNYEQPEQVVNWYYSNEEKLAEVESEVLEDTVIEKLMEQVTINEVESTYEEVMRPAPQAEEEGSEA